AAGANPGRYRLGALELEVGTDQVVRLPGSDNFAGSALRPMEGVARAARMLGCSWRDAWDRLSEIPARWMELPAGLAVGSVADLFWVRSADGIRMASWQVIGRGEALPTRRGH